MTVLTLGTFDLFHAGHVEFLRRCRYIGASWMSPHVVVGLNTDRFAGTYKRPPIIDYEGRAAVLRACRYVDDVVPNDQADGTAADVIGLVYPRVIAVSMDWHPSTGRDWYEQIGLAPDWFDGRSIRIEWVPYTPGVSTSAIVAAL